MATARSCGVDYRRRAQRGNYFSSLRAFLNSCPYRREKVTADDICSMEQTLSASCNFPSRFASVDRTRSRRVGFGPKRHHLSGVTPKAAHSAAKCGLKLGLIKSGFRLTLHPPRRNSPTASCSAKNRFLSAPAWRRSLSPTRQVQAARNSLSSGIGGWRNRRQREWPIRTTYALT